MSQIPIMEPKICCEKKDCKKSAQCRFSTRKITKTKYEPTLAVRLNKVKGNVKLDCRDFE
jgi:hypothetical protein